MGRTLPTFNTYLQHEMEAWRPFRRTLRKDEKELFDRLFTRARLYTAESTSMARPVPFDCIVMSILLGQERELAALRRQVEELQQQASTAPASKSITSDDMEDV